MHREPARIKGPRKAARAPAIKARGRESLSREAEEALFGCADVLCEGAMQDNKDGGQSWFGSTMLTFDARRLSQVLREEIDAYQLGRLAYAMQGSVRVRLRATRIAREEVARRLAGANLGTATVETRVRWGGEELHMDVDLEVPIVVSSRRSSSGSR